jgi:colicin import membrane protein
VLQREGEPPLEVNVDEQTEVMKDGRPAQVSDLSQGSEVRIQYRVEADQPIAERIEITGDGQG